MIGTARSLNVRSSSERILSVHLTNVHDINKYFATPAQNVNNSSDNLILNYNLVLHAPSSFD